MNKSINYSKLKTVSSSQPDKFLIVQNMASLTMLFLRAWGINPVKCVGNSVERGGIFESRGQGSTIKTCLADLWAHYAQNVWTRVALVRKMTQISDSRCRTDPFVIAGL